MSGQGCIICSGKFRKGTEQFINEALKIHGDKFVYSKVKYINSNTKVCIICPEHGEFWQRPANHLQGQGCPQCRAHLISQHKLKEEKEYIESLKKVWGDRYDFSKIEYHGNKTKTIVICKKHGEFLIRPNDLLCGHGCPECGKSYRTTELNLLKKLQEIFKHVEYEYTFDFLKSKTSNQTLDYYLPEYNIAIEYQGRQHFKPISVFGGEESYRKTVERDEKKFKKCKEHGIKLYYISFEKDLPDTYLDKIYTDVNELINEIKQIKK